MHPPQPDDAAEKATDDDGRPPTQRQLVEMSLRRKPVKEAKRVVERDVRRGTFR